MDMLKKALLVGIGTLALTKDRMEQFVDQAVARGEMSKEEGRNFLNEAMERADEQKQWLSGKIREETRRIVENAGFATKDEVEALRVHLASIEAKLDRLISTAGPSSETEIPQA